MGKNSPLILVSSDLITFEQIRLQQEEPNWKFRLISAARLSGERVKELEDLDRDDVQGGGPLMERAQRFIFHHAKNFGFFTILLFASVSRPVWGSTCERRP